MIGTSRVAKMILVAASCMTITGCGGAGGEGGEPGGGGDMGSERAEGPPDVGGTWVGGYEEGGGGTLVPWLDEYEAEGGGTLMLELDQDGGELSGYGTAALVAEGEFPFFVHDLTGRVTSDDRVSATAGVLGASEDERLSFDARVKGETMEYRGEDASESIELERIRTDLPEGMGLAAVQAVYSRDWVWFAVHVSGDLEDSLEVDHEDEVEAEHPFGALTQMVFMQYEDEMAYADEEDEPTMGARVSLDEGSVVTNEVDSSRVTVEFDFETSDGRGGDANVSLVRAGTAGSGYSYRIDGFTMEYESASGATYDMSMSY